MLRVACRGGEGWKESSMIHGNGAVLNVRHFLYFQTYFRRSEKETQRRAEPRKSRSIVNRLGKEC